MPGQRHIPDVSSFVNFHLRSRSLNRIANVDLIIIERRPSSGVFPLGTTTAQARLTPPNRICYDLGAMVLELEATQAQVQRILQSKAFRTSEVQRNLLAYLADKSLAGTSDSLKEYTVGLDVFGKPASYDPRQESTVRMHVGRLRQKLAEYYRTEGADDPIIVDLPKGGFRVVFEPRPEALQPEPAAPEIVIAPPSYRREVVLAVALLLAIASAFYFAEKYWSVERTTSAANSAAAVWTPELQQLWAPIINSKRPLLICLATPSSGVTALGAGHGAFLLGQFLGGRIKDVQLTPSDQLSMPELAMGNVVVLGPDTRGRQRAIPSGQQIVLEPDGIRILSPRAGEPAFLPERPPADRQDPTESYALISHLPGLNGNGELLYFSGNATAAVMGAVQGFTDPASARTLVSKLTAHGSLPRYFQVVLKVRSMDDMPIDVAYLLHREIPAEATRGTSQ